MKPCKHHFTHWFAGEIGKGSREGKDVEDIKMDFHLSTIKPIHAKWLIDVHVSMKEKSELIIDEFKKSGIFDSLFSVV